MRGLFLILASTAALAAPVPASAIQRGHAPAPAGCHIALPPSPDVDSFTAAGRNGAAAANLAQQTGAAFSAAINRLCASGVVRPAAVARYRSLLVRNAEGATSPNVYDDAEEHPGVLIVEFAFAGGGPPTQAQIEAALRCWRNPQGAGCQTEDMGP
jgi:hypothetical protein